MTMVTGNLGRKTYVQTVLGPIDPGQLGFTLPHEHFFCGSASANFEEPKEPALRANALRPVSLEIRQWLEYNWHANKDNLVLDDEPLAIEEAGYYTRAGGKGFIDVTSIGINRNPLGLVRIAQATGLHIVMGSSVYVQATHPPEIAKMSRYELCEQTVKDFNVGVDGTGIKAGVIGEIGVSWPITPDETKCLLAGCDAQKVLGAALYIHPGKHPGSIRQIVDVLKTTKVDMRKVVMCHMERTLQDIPQIIEMLKLGIMAEYDLFGRETTGVYYRNFNIDMLSDAQRLDHFRQLIDAGFLSQLLMSHDVSFKHMWHKHGGNGYDHILVNTIPWMKIKGFSQAEIDAITVENPRRVVEMGG
jgi:phosphotriesterase-related protein